MEYAKYLVYAAVVIICGLLCIGEFIKVEPKLWLIVVAALAFYLGFVFIREYFRAKKGY